MDPITFGIIGVSALGTLLGMDAERKQAEAEAISLEQAAGQFDENARLVRNQANLQADRRRRMDAQILGSIRASFAASGAAGANDKDVIRMNENLARENAMLIQYEGFIQSERYRKEARRYRQQAGLVRQGGSLSSLGVGLSGATRILERVG